MQENVWFSTILHAYGEVDEERKWNEILEVMVSIYTMPSIFPFSYFHLRKAPPSHHLQQHSHTKIIDEIGERKEKKWEND